MAEASPFQQSSPFQDAAGPGSGGFAERPPGASRSADGGDPRRPVPRVLLAAAAAMTGNPTAGVAQYVTDLTAGTTYELTGWVISDTGGTYIGSKGYDSTGGVSRASGSTSWSELTMTFEAVGDKTEIFCWQAVAGNGYCTDVTLRALN